MRSKAPLAMMEQIVMLAVFALAAALCLQAFVQSDRLSKNSEVRDRAMTLCQSAAETVRQCAGDFEAAGLRLGSEHRGADSFLLFYGADWRQSTITAPDVWPFGYTLGAERVETDVPGLGKATVWVQQDETGEELFRLEVAWQEVNAGE